MLLAPFDEQIHRSAGVWPPINIVAEENMNSSPRANRHEVSIYDGEHLLQQIGAAMNIADGVDAYPVREPRLANFGCRSRQSQHLPVFSIRGTGRAVRNSFPDNSIVNDFIRILEVFDSILETKRRRISNRCV